MRLPVWPVLASEHGGHTDALFIAIHVLMGVIFAGWMLFFVYALIRFRGARSPQAEYGGARTRAPYYLAGAVLAAELLLDFGVSGAVRTPEDGGDSVRIRVIAQQFAWNVHYPGADGVFGRTSASLVDDLLNPIGLDPEDSAGKDDLVLLNQMTLPIGRPVEIALSSKDVVHSFNVPEFRVKQDATPGVRSTVRFTPTMTTARFRELKGGGERTFEIACAQLCGQGHYNMRGYVTVATAEEYEAWLAETAAKTGESAGEDDFWN